MLKKYLAVIIFVLTLSCPAFASDWDGITYKLQTKDITFQINQDIVSFNSDSGDSQYKITSVTDESDYYKITMESDRFIMLSKELDRGKVGIDNIAYMFHRQ